jgi:DNA-directed RNA polymerase subunit RPC12/RpoP
MKSNIVLGRRVGTFSSCIVSQKDNSIRDLTCPHCGATRFYQISKSVSLCCETGDEVMCAECSYKFIVADKHYKEVWDGY